MGYHPKALWGIAPEGGHEIDRSWAMGGNYYYPTQHSAPPVNGSGPHRLVITRIPDPEPAGVGKAHWVGDASPHKPPKERKGEERERERERDPHHELAI